MTSALILKTLLFTILVPGTVTVLVPWLILSSSGEPCCEGIGGLRSLALLPILAGISIYAWCAYDFALAGGGTPAPVDPPKQLVVRGLYRFTRNPMYVGVLCLLFGEALFFASLRVLVYAVGLWAIFHLFVVGYEERALRRKFGASYQRYCASVPRWVPRARRPGARR